MSSLSKLRKNAENYKINQFYQNMTPEQYQEGIRIAIQKTTNDLTKQYNENLERLKEEANRNISQSATLAIDTISVELLYELGRQLGCFEENAEYLEEKIDKVRDIYINTMEAINKYTKYKKGNQARKDFEKKKHKVQKMFKVEF